MDFSRRWIKFFGDFEQKRLEELGLKVKEAMRKDDRAVADGLFEAFGILIPRLAAFNSDAEQEDVLESFENAIGMAVEDAVEECLETMLFAGDYERGEEMCRVFAEQRLADATHMAEHRAELLVRLGRTEEAEEALIAELERAPQDAWLYVSLGDTFFAYQPIEALRDPESAEAWYYRGYDRGLANEKTDSGKTLLKRLGKVCIDRLRRRATSRLVSALAPYGMGPNTYVQLTTSIRKDGFGSELLAHVGAIAARDDSDNGAELREALGDAVRLLPQDALDELSPFEVDVLVQPGKQEQRIADDMKSILSIEEIQKDPSLQASFLNAKDPETGRVRRVLIEREREKTRKNVREGKVLWKGFTKYREAPSLETLFAEAGAPQQKVPKSPRKGGPRSGCEGSVSR